MNRNTFKTQSTTLQAALATGALALSLAACASAAPKLTMNGKVASTKVRTINGAGYVSIADMAKALGMVVVKKGDGYEIKKPGGTYQVQDLTGKMGDVLFDGKWRFQVLSVETPESFKMRTESSPYDHYSVSTYDTETRTFRPKESYKLIVIKVRITNAQKVPQTMWTAISDKTMRTALTDSDGQSYPPLDYDYEGGPTVTKPLLPGASMTFPIIFGVREETVLKDLVYTLKNNESFAKGNDARVSLAPASTPVE
jgi:hypothetical protein